MEEEKTQSQVEEPQDAGPDTADAERDQQTEETPSGAEEPRIYTQEEVSAMQAASDKQVADARQRLAQQSLLAEASRIQVAEEQALAQDKQQVEEGTLTSEEAKQKQDVRAQDAASRQAMQSERTTHQRMLAEGEQVGRVLAAKDFSEK